MCMGGQTEVRKFAFSLLKRKSKNSPFHLPSIAEFTRFEAQKIRGPTRKNFRVQLTGSLSCQWNRHATDVFSRAFVKKMGNKFKREELVACFKVHLCTLRNQYERIKAGPAQTQVEIKYVSSNARRMQRQGVSVPRITY